MNGWLFRKLKQSAGIYDAFPLHSARESCAVAQLGRVRSLMFHYRENCITYGKIVSVTKYTAFSTNLFGTHFDAINV
jgi:hypothetical protein